MNTEHPCKFSLVKCPTEMKPSDFQNFSLLQFVPRRLLSIANGMAHFPGALYHRIHRVLLFCSKPKMIWIYTSRVISARTVVKNAQSFWNWSDGQNPGRKMGTNLPVDLCSSMNLAVAFRVFTSNPDPTRFGFLNLRPEALWEGVIQSLRSKVLRRNLAHVRLVLPSGLLAWAAFSLSQNRA